MTPHQTVLFSAFAAAALVALAAACGTPREPVRHVGQAEVAIEGAQQANDARPGALDLRVANDKLERAKAALRDKDYERADRLAEEASLDAEVARVKAESDTAQKDADQLEIAIRQLRDEAQRGARMPE
jgi:uncharacterized protein DUF4398